MVNENPNNKTIKITVAAALTGLGFAIAMFSRPTTAPDLEPRPTQIPQQTVPQLPADSALDSLVRDSNIIFIPGAGGDSVEAIVDSINRAVNIPSDTLRYNQFWQPYRQ